LTFQNHICGRNPNNISAISDSQNGIFSELPFEPKALQTGSYVWVDLDHNGVIKPPSNIKFMKLSS
jgi:hypothetical protein